MLDIDSDNEQLVEELGARAFSSAKEISLGVMARAALVIDLAEYSKRSPNPRSAGLEGLGCTFSTALPFCRKAEDELGGLECIVND